MRYPFRCPACGLEFVVSRPISEAAGGAACPADGTAAERVFTVPEMGFNRPAPPRPRAGTPARPARGFSHAGHSHGAGTAPHSH